MPYQAERGYGAVRRPCRPTVGRLHTRGSPRYVERGDLVDRISDSSERHSSRPVLLHEEPGCGTTQVALRYAQKYEKHYRLLPAECTGHVLITSSNPDWPLVSPRRSSLTRVGWQPDLLHGAEVPRFNKDEESGLRRLDDSRVVIDPVLHSTGNGDQDVVPSAGRREPNATGSRADLSAHEAIATASSTSGPSARVGSSGTATCEMAAPLRSKKMPAYAHSFSRGNRGASSAGTASSFQMPSRVAR